MTRWQRRFVFWGTGLLLGLAGVLGWGSAADASPEHTRAPQDHNCWWELRTLGDHRQPILRCSAGINPARVPDDHKPPIPSNWNCVRQRITHGLGDQGPTMEMRCPREGMIYVECQNQDGLFGQQWLDYAWEDHKAWVQIPDNSPQWWRDAIRLESESARNGDGGQGCHVAEHPPQTTCAERDITTYDSPGLLPDECWGTYPTASYEVGWAEDGNIFHFKNEMQGWTGSFMYNIGKGAIVTALWLIGWAFSFDITEYTQFAKNLAANYQNNIIGPFGLEDIVWYVLIVWAGFTALRGKLGMAGGEILAAVVLAAVATVLFTNRVIYMDEIARAMDETSARLLVAGQTQRCVTPSRVPPGRTSRGQGNCPDGEVLIDLDPRRVANIREEVRPLQQHIHEAFIEQPYAYLNWGRVTTDKCLTAQNQIIAMGYNDDGWPGRHMGRAGCTDEAAFNGDETGEKMLGAFLTMLAALITAFLLGLMALTVVISKFLVALLFAIIPFAALGAILPGGARRMAWSWFGTLVQLVVAVVCMSFLLALLMLGVDEILHTTRDLGLVERWFIVLLIVSAVYFGRRRLLAGSKSLAENLANAMTKLTPAGALSNTGNWGGVDFLGVDRSVGRTAGRTVRTAGIAGAYAAIGVGSAAAGGLALAGRTVVVRRAEARVARRNLRNLYEIQGSYRHWDGLKMTEFGQGGRGGASMPVPSGLGGGPGGMPGGRLPGGGPRPAGGGPPPSRPAVAMPSSLQQTPSGLWVPAGSHAPEPAFMVQNAAQPHVNVNDRRQLWEHQRDVHGIRPIHDKGITRFTRPFSARSERRMHRWFVQQHQQLTQDGLRIQRDLRGVSRGARLVDRRGRPFGWP